MSQILISQCLYIAKTVISSSYMQNNLHLMTEQACFILDCIKIPKENKKCTYLWLVVNVSSPSENTPHA